MLSVGSIRIKLQEDVYISNRCDNYNYPLSYSAYKVEGDTNPISEYEAAQIGCGYQFPSQCGIEDGLYCHVEREEDCDFHDFVGYYCMIYTV